MGFAVALLLFCSHAAIPADDAAGQLMLTLGLQVHDGARDAVHSEQVLAIQVRGSPRCSAQMRLQGSICSICCTTKIRRSLFMWYMWRIADVDTEVLE